MDIKFVKLGTPISALIEDIKKDQCLIVLNEKGEYYGILPSDILIRVAFNLHAKIDKFVVRVHPLEKEDLIETIEKMLLSNLRVLPIKKGDRIEIITVYDILNKIKDSEFFDEEVGKYMHEEVITINEKDPITKAIAIMKRKGVSRLIVLDKNGKPIGILTAGDIVRSILFEKEKQKFGEFTDRKFSVEVRSIVNKNLIYVSRKDKLRKACELILKNKIFALPVINGKLEGVISIKEILAGYLSYVKKKEYKIIVHGIRIDEYDYDWIKKRFERLIEKYSEVIGEDPTLILHIKKVRETVEQDNTMRFFVIRAKLIGSKIKLYASDEGVDLYSTINTILHIFSEELEKRKYKREREYLFERLLREGLI